VILGTLGVNSGKEAFWTFLEHKSEENGKDLIFLAGNSRLRRQEGFFDGVRSKMDDGAEKT
jgi:proteasome assembly chaperone (PAC2) family protein